MAIPSLLPVVGWGGFAIVLLVSGILSTFYIRYYRNKRSSVCSSTTTGVISLMVTLGALALIPVDIFVVSYMKDPDGEFKEWASNNETRAKVETAILYTYYILYSLIIAFLFLVIPFAIFFYEEEDEDITLKSRLFQASKFTACFVGFAVTLLLVGAFIPDSSSAKSGGSAWEEFQHLIKEIGESRGENALYFLISFVTLVGMLAIVIYTSYGMIIIPIDMLRGKRDTEEELREMRSRRERNEEQRRRLERRYSERRTTASSYRNRQDDLEDEELLIQQSEERLVAIRDDHQRGFLHKCSLLWWPFRVIVAVTLLTVDLLIVLSLFLTSLDRAMHSSGPKTGYMLSKRVLPNPLDIILVLSQEIFPMDFIIFLSILMFFMWASMAGIRKIGIWFCCLRMYKIRPHRTKAQGVLFMCMFMMYILMALNIMMYSLAPDYLSFGNQKYSVNGSHAIQCTIEAGDECIFTVTTALLATFTLNFWFFGACYYWTTWLFMAFVVISIVVAILKKPTSSIEGAVDSSDLDDSDDELVQP
ncbi:probable lysosomal cobalamin transporter isoform X2 [Apostichopus japonicus]|uniref:probable lysosomal cobalamin transporter isoform X2 n=1 Tax=Stichopus japonicus TaxID=307972 RepID=UPI003AB45ED0